ncbi:hypothetical protein FHS37_003404 [Streptomyces griseostramineus]|uniref:Uncharacterized protein n=1 Tax=Streptomyces griseomycini TaxID=66895 RepID=A0A7W7PR76_9ACTN|nr:hypothetical protein [Streptomyces griseomycini]
MGRPSIRCTWRIRSPSAAKASGGSAGHGRRHRAEHRPQTVGADLVEHPRQRGRVVDRVRPDTLERFEDARHAQRVRVGGEVTDRVDRPAPGGVHGLVLTAPAGRRRQFPGAEFDAQLGRPEEQGDALRTQPADRRGHVPRCGGAGRVPPRHRPAESAGAG